MDRKITRRSLVGGLAIGAGGLLTGCDRLNENESFRKLLYSAEDANFVVQRSLLNRMKLAREYSPADISPTFRANGSTDPSNAEYRALAASNFVDWRLKLTGAFATPSEYSLAELKAMPTRKQITRHDCVEGWSAIGKWTGVPLKLLLDAAGLKKKANYLVFRCADLIGGVPYYESIDLIDAYHPQTILAWGLNDKDVPIANGAPLRLRVERQLGYKHAKYLMEIEAVESLANIGDGNGGYWEDRIGYEWYAGI